MPDDESEACYFSDGKRRVDYVIVTDDAYSFSVMDFLESLNDKQLDYEIVAGQKIKKTFILIHLRPTSFTYYSQAYDIGLEEKRKYIKTRIRIFGKYSDTPVSEIPDKVQGELYSNDRILIVNKILDELGLPTLITEKCIETAYPLHDGPCGRYESYTNDRQLLLMHGANLKYWYKEPPLDLINKYYGTEIAFYFAWVQFFNIMLISAAIFGIIVTIINVINVQNPNLFEIKKICEDQNLTVCATCGTPGLCFFRKLSQFCYEAKRTYVFDNTLTVAFAVFMSFWATFFLNFWKRRENELSLKWDARYDRMRNIRIQYQQKATINKPNNITGEDQYFVPLQQRAYCLTYSIVVCFLLVLLVFLVIVVLILLKMVIRTTFVTWDYTRPHAKFLTLVVGCILQVTFIKLFGSLFYGRLCIALTNIENPRTEADFRKSVLYKKYVLSFVNNYAPLFYMAFLKGRFYKYPKAYGESIFAQFIKDTCQPLNCVVDLGIQLAFIMFLKQMAGNLLVLLWPAVVDMTKHQLRKKLPEKQRVVQYEEEYLLEPFGTYKIAAELCEMTIEYGFVTFFVAAFPLAPFLSFVNNLMEQRLDVYKFLVRFQRPVPRKTAGIGSWNGILLGMTYLSTVINAFVIAFTSDFVHKEVYRYTSNFDMENYINYTLSEFATKDYPGYSKINPPEICVYRHFRYPYWHRHAYKKSKRYWKDTTWRLATVFIFEHIIFLLNGILVRIIPTIPTSVKEQMKIDRKLALEASIDVSDEERGTQERLGIRNRQRDLPRAAPIVTVIST